MIIKSLKISCVIGALLCPAFVLAQHAADGPTHYEHKRPHASIESDMVSSESIDFQKSGDAERTKINCRCLIEVQQGQPCINSEGQSQKMCTASMAYSSAKIIMPEAIMFVTKSPIGILAPSDGVINPRNELQFNFMLFDPIKQAMFEKYLYDNDISTDYTNRIPIRIRVEHLWFSYAKAKTMGIDLKLFNGNIIDQFPRLVAGSGAATFNFGDMKMHLFTLTLKWMNSKKILFNRFSFDTDVFQLGELSPTNSMTMYRNNNIGADKEYTRSGITGTVSQHSSDPDVVTIENFKSVYFIPTAQKDGDDGKQTTLGENFGDERPRDLRLPYNEPQVFFNHDFTTSIFSENQNLTGISVGKDERQFRLVSVATALRDDNANDPEALTVLDSENHIYSYTSKALRDMPVGDFSSVKECLSPSYFHTEVFNYAMGMTGQLVGIQIVPTTKITQLAANTHIKMTLKGDKIFSRLNSTKQLTLGNLMAGPYFLTDMNANFLMGNFDEPIRFSIEIEDDPIYRKVHQNQGINKFKIKYEFLYQPNTKKVDRLNSPILKM